MRFFQEAFAGLAAYRSIEQAKANGISPVSLTGVAQIHKAQLLVTLCQSGTVLAVTGDEAEAKRLCDDINAMEQAQTAVLFPSKELLVTAVEGVSAEYEHARLAAVTALQQGISRVVIASMEALMQPTIPPEQLQKETIRLRQGDAVNQTELIQHLTAMGYVRGESVEGAGQFAVRGDIIDLFPVQLSAPVRMELWGDEIDTMGSFDPETQRRTEALEAVLIPPAKETLFDPEQLAQLIEAHSQTLRGKLMPHGKSCCGMRNSCKMELGFLMQISTIRCCIHSRHCFPIMAWIQLCSANMQPLRNKHVRLWHSIRRIVRFCWRKGISVGDWMATTRNRQSSNTAWSRSSAFMPAISYRADSGLRFRSC